MNSSPLSKSQNMGNEFSQFKQSGLYYLINPNGSNIRGINVCRSFGFLWTIVNLIILVYGAVGFVYSAEPNNGMNLSDHMHVAVAYIMYIQCLLKNATFIFKANSIWLMLRMKRSYILDSIHYHKHAAVLQQYREQSRIIIKVLGGIMILAGIEWIFYPFALNWLYAKDTYQWRHQYRFQNIYNIPFPVTIQTYNYYYPLFYVFELLVIVFLLYVSLIFNIFFITLCYDIIGSYEVISRSFENIGHNKTLSLNPNDHKKTENASPDDDYYKDFKSVLIDQQKLYLVLKSYYSIIRNIIIITVIMNSSGITSASYLFVVVITSAEASSYLLMLKLAATAAYLFFDLFLICYLIDNINAKNESVKYSMYCCNWTMMNIKLKKLLLLSMMMHDANRLMIKISPNVIINLQLFSSVMKTSFNIVTVMLKSQYK